MITYQTDRLILTPPRPEHEADLFRLHNDPLVQEMVFNNVPQTAEDVRKWLEWFFTQWRKNGFGDWMVYEKANHGPNFIGRCGLRDFGDTGNLELATSLCEQGRGRRLGLEAARFALKHALQSSNKGKIVALVKHGNARSQRTASILGLRYIDDRWHAGKFWQYYELTREQYFSQPEQQVTG